jgi:hypothetical protein
MMTNVANMTNIQARMGDIVSKTAKKTYTRMSTMNIVNIASIAASTSGMSTYYLLVILINPLVLL